MDKSEPNREDTQYVLLLSYGKDSLACLGACEKLGWRIDRIVHAEVWATDTISADLPPMVEFKRKADEIIKDRWGIEVEHYCAMRGGLPNNYERQFYTNIGEKAFRTREKDVGKPCQQQLNRYYGFPLMKGAWCNSELKIAAIKEANKKVADVNTVKLLGIAADEPKRLERLDGIHKVSPLAEIGWTEADCMEWCIKNDLRSPIYDNSNRGGCWFCHNQSVDQLRQLRHNYPDLWALLLKWDLDSAYTFKADARTVHDFDRRFELEDKGLVPSDRTFRWQMTKYVQERIF